MKILCYSLFPVWFLLLSSCVLAPVEFDEKEWQETVNKTDIAKLYAPNQSDNTYFTPWLNQENHGFSNFLYWQLSKKKKYTQAEQTFLPQVIPDLKARLQAFDDTDFIVWLGHGTFLIRLSGHYFLTDPIFSNRALLPKRLTPPALNEKDILELNLKVNVIISHNHYDHLDESSLKNLPENASFIVPKGLKNYVSSLTSGEVHEMNWWEAITPADTITITSLPAQHWSRRLCQGYNETLWASYMIRSENKTVYFGGDSGYFRGYREFARHFPQIDYALLPVTAYEPRWFMHYAHMNSSEAITAFSDLGAKNFIPTQWGTFHLGDNPPGLPALHLQRDIDNLGLDKTRFHILDIGEILPLENYLP